MSTTITPLQQTQTLTRSNRPQSHGPVGEFVRQRADQTLGSLNDVRGGGGQPREAASARATYNRHAGVSHDLSDRTQVGQLISRSPQLDNSSASGGDTTRCGGASLFNAMLLDGDYRANAGAIGHLASDRHVQLTRPEQQALDAMRGGHLTANQAAELQDVLYRTADTGDTRATGQGLTGVEMSSTVAALSQYGAFPNTSEVNFRMTDSGGGAHHWTTSSTTTAGTAHADSWPGANGYAQVSAGRGQTGTADANFTADVTLRHPAGGNPTITTRAADGDQVIQNGFELGAHPRGLGAHVYDRQSGALIR